MTQPARNDFIGTVVVQIGAVGLESDLSDYQLVGQ
jgi:hypothetical protein